MSVFVKYFLRTDVKSSFDLLIPGNQPIFLVVIVTAGVMLLSYMFWNCYYYDISLVSKKNISVMEREDDCPQNGIILLFYNPKSGSFNGSRILSRVKKHHDQVLTFCMSDSFLPSTLKFIIPSSQMRIVICGGDISLCVIRSRFLNNTEQLVGYFELSRRPDGIIFLLSVLFL